MKSPTEVYVGEEGRLSEGSSGETSVIPAKACKFMK